MPDLTLVRPAQRTPLERAVDDYLAHCRANGLSQKTINDVYGSTLRRRLLPFCEEAGIDDPANLTRKDLERLQERMLTEPSARGGVLSRASVHSYMRSINSFLSYLREDDRTITVRAQLPRIPKRIIDTLERSEIDQLEDATSTERDALIVRILADTGVRVGELIGLRLGDITVRGRNRYLRVRGKGDKERLVPIVPELHIRLARYIDRKRPTDARSDHVFIGLRRDRRTGEYEPLTESGVAQLLKGLAFKIGMTKRLHPHLFRHSYATWCLRRGMNPIQLADIMGHTSLTMIHQVYAHLTPDDSYAAMMKVLREDG